MMNREELQKMYEEGELDDPTMLQTYRDEIHRYTGLRPPRSMVEIEEWWLDNKSVFSRRIKPSKESQALEESDTNGDNE